MNTLRGFVPRMGVEPTRPNGHMALNHACLPVPAPGQLDKRDKYREVISDFLYPRELIYIMNFDRMTL